MHAGSDEILTKPRQHVAANRAVAVDRRNEIGKYTVEIGHGDMLQNSRAR
jgi:hypothetical protein